METLHTLNMESSIMATTYEQLNDNQLLEDVFSSCPTQTLDTRSCWRYKDEFDDLFLLSDSFSLDDDVCCYLDFASNHTSAQENYWLEETEVLGFFNLGSEMMNHELEPLNQSVSTNGQEIISSANANNKELVIAKVEKCKAVKNTSKAALSKETIAEYFYLPIIQAAKELNVGLTLLKKRCRELGIRRWPHRKLMSIQTLIHNVQEFEKAKGEGKVREYMEQLEQEKKLVEEIPHKQLENKIKRLRQACFKASYKKRKLMGRLVKDAAASSSSSSVDENTLEQIILNMGQSC